MAETTFSLTDDNELLEFEMIPTGPRGLPGDDGYSPTVTVQDITGGHRVVITDAQGPHTFDVMDGQGGGDAVESVNGKTGVVELNASDVHALPDTTQIDEVAVQSAQPTSQTNKMWINSEVNGEVQLALYSDIHSALTKILDVTLSEEAALIVTEIDGEPMSVDELHMVVKCPTGVDISAGSAFVYSGSTTLGEAYHVARTSSDTGIYWFASFKKDGGVWASKMSRTISSGSLVQVWEYFVSDLVNERYARSCITYPHITKLQLPAFPSGTRVVLYAR